MDDEKKIEQFYRDVERLKLKFPVARISEATGYGKGTVSLYLSRKDDPSANFLKSFYEKFGEKLQKEGSLIVFRDKDELLNELYNRVLRLEAIVSVLQDNEIGVLSQLSGKSPASVRLDFQDNVTKVSELMMAEEKKNG